MDRPSQKTPRKFRCRSRPGEAGDRRLALPSGALSKSGTISSSAVSDHGSQMTPLAAGEAAGHAQAAKKAITTGRPRPQAPTGANQLFTNSGPKEFQLRRLKILCKFETCLGARFLTATWLKAIY